MCWGNVAAALPRFLAWPCHAGRAPREEQMGSGQESAPRAEHAEFQGLGPCQAPTASPERCSEPSAPLKGRT